MKAATKQLLNYFLIGILAVIPIIVVLQIIFFIKDLLMGVFGFGKAKVNSARLRQQLRSFLYLCVLRHQFFFTGLYRPEDRDERPPPGHPLF